MGVFGRTLGWLKTAGASILRTPVEIAQRHRDVVCLMLEEDCSSSFLSSKMLGTDEAAVFIVTVVAMVLVKRWRRGGRFLQDQVCDEDGADEDAEGEQDAAAAAAAQEAAEEKVHLLEGVNQEVLDRLDEEQRQRVVFEGAVEAQREGHRNQVAAMQRRLQAELASEHQQHQENLDRAHELLATRNRDNEVLVEQAAAAERTVEEMRREREAAAIVATQLQEEHQLAAVRLSEQNQARLAAVREELATSDDEKAVWSQRATVAERQVEEINREREAAAIVAAQLQEEQQLAAVRLSEQNLARLAAVREELATSDDEKAAWTQRATVAERQVEEIKREREAAAIAAAQLQEEQQLAAVRLSEQNQARLAAVREELATSDDEKAAWTQRATVAERQVEEIKREREAAAIAAAQLQEEQQLAAVRLSEQNQARLAAVREELATSDEEKAAWTQRATVAERQVEEIKRRTAEETGQRETPTFNADVNETSATSSKVQQHRLAGYEKMATHTKPLVEGVQAWSDKSVIITIDNCGNCYQSSWFLVTILWAVQCPKRLRELIIKLLRGFAQDGALVHVPPHYQRYVEAVFLFLITTQKCWGYHASFPENDDGDDDFGIKQAVRIVEILSDVRGLATGTVEGGCNEDSLGLHLKRGLAIVARAFDVSWANRNGFPNMDIVATLHQSMEFDVGLQLTLMKSARDAVEDAHHPPSTLPPYVPQDIMRPACSLGYIVGMAMEDMGNNGHANRTRYVEAVFLFLITTQKCWGYHASFPENDDGDDDFGIKQAVRIVEILSDVRGLATGTVEGGCNEDSLGLHLKRGLAIVARAFDVSWANRNGFPNMDIVATLHQSMEFDVGLQLTLMKSARDAVEDAHHPPSTLPPYVPQDIMRPACSLGYIVGMAMEDMGNNGHANRTDLTDTYASIATEAAEAQGRPNHTSIAGMLVWKASCPHYNVNVQSGALANALASTFGLDLSEGDAVASAELREGSRWQRENAMGIGGAIDPDELELLMAEARKVEAATSNPQDSSAAAAAAAPASSPASLAAANRNDAQRPLPGTNDGVHASSEPWKTSERRRRKKKKKK
ncbi:hypothetical protein Esi_0106_0035 [Ectocarpus siliculosus]|uniref:Uncharacterized protein n=1 Tax=Ectocarpus siliculosus TaxID=2880 RepID=D7FH85_ECTSI|nr:hypothetical protein Esi_0106_0035 [Ectocarpus siliculosus]|eukprot:CBJ28456.1 hypothetical protein Esi_0106_0035 [Ectocarpus siliculosus]